MIPFLYQVSDTKFVVKYGKFSYIHYNSDWMCDKTLGNACLIPELDDIEQVEYVFDNESDALECMKNLWASLKI